MQIAFLLFDGVTALDAVGPYEVLSRLPDADVCFVAASPGPQRADCRALALVADHALADVTEPDIVVIPGGPGSRQLLTDEQVLEWVREVHRGSRWTTSVCTGALILGAAGVLEGRRATTHWRSVSRLADFGATPAHERVVTDGKVITAAGVSAGIDMALRLAQREAGDDIAEAIQLIIEYSPEPPFASGSEPLAASRIVDLARELTPG